MPWHYRKCATQVDYRLSWIGKIVERMLNIRDENIFTNFLKDDNNKNEKRLIELCSGQDSSVTTTDDMILPYFPFVIFWTTTEEVEESLATRQGEDMGASGESEDDFDPPTDDLTDDHAPPQVAKGSTSLLAHAVSSINLQKDSELAISTSSVAGSMGSVSGDGQESNLSTIDEEILKITMKKRSFRVVLHLVSGNSKQFSDGTASVEECGLYGSEQKKLFLIRISSGKIPIPSSIEDAFVEMPRHYELYMSGDEDATHFVNSINNVYGPLINADHQRDVLQLQNYDHIYQLMNFRFDRFFAKQEFLLELNQYTTYLSSRKSALPDFFSLPEELKDIGLEDPSLLLDSPHLTEKIENVCCVWAKSMEDTLNDLQTKLQKCSAPLEEANFWQDAHRLLNNVIQSMETDEVNWILHHLGQSSSNTSLDNFKFHSNELRHFFLQTKEISQYMGILKPSFLIIENHTSFSEVRKTISPLLSSLRLMWAISRFYNTSDRMAPLLQRIANLLAARVVKTVTIEDFLKTPCANFNSGTSEKSTSHINVLEAKLMLEEWKKSYLELRAFNDFNSQVPMWEFDRKRLFERTDHISGVCQNILDVFEALHQFGKTLCPELETAFHETERIKMLRSKVDELPRQVFDMSYNPLELHNAATWKFTMEHFRREIAVIDMDCIRLLDDGFGHLRNAQSALELLEMLDRVNCRPAIKEHAFKKFKLTAEKLMSEIDNIHNKFTFKDNRYWFRNFPPVASSVFWSKCLLRQLEPAINLFSKCALDPDSEPFRELANNKYADLVTRVREFGENKVKIWAESAIPQINVLLQNSLLRKLPVDNETDEVPSRFNYEVNFPIELWTIISEAKHLENMGFILPLKLRLTALQEQTYIKQLFLLKSAVDRGKRISMKPNVEKDKNFQELKKQLDRGCYRINWTSLKVESFLESCFRILDCIAASKDQSEKNVLSTILSVIRFR